MTKKVSGILGVTPPPPWNKFLAMGLFIQVVRSRRRTAMSGYCDVPLADTAEWFTRDNINNLVHSVCVLW